MGHQSDNNKKDTGERLDAIEDGIEDVKRGLTPPMGTLATREDARRIAEEIETKSRPAREQACWRDGPAFHLQREISNMNNRLGVAEASINSLNMQRARDDEEAERNKENDDRDSKRKSRNFVAATTLLGLVLGGLTLLNGYLGRSASASLTQPASEQVNAAILRRLSEVAAKLDANARKGPTLP